MVRVVFYFHYIYIYIFPNLVRRTKLGKRKSLKDQVLKYLRFRTNYREVKQLWD